MEYNHERKTIIRKKIRDSKYIITKNLYENKEIKDWLKRNN